jgi:hypothetical protein
MRRCVLPWPPFLSWFRTDVTWNRVRQQVGQDGGRVVSAMMSRSGSPWQRTGSGHQQTSAIAAGPQDGGGLLGQPRGRGAMRRLAAGHRSRLAGPGAGAERAWSTSTPQTDELTGLQRYVSPEAPQCTKTVRLQPSGVLPGFSGGVGDDHRKRGARPRAGARPVTSGQRDGSGRRRMVAAWDSNDADAFGGLDTEGGTTTSERCVTCVG